MIPRPFVLASIAYGVMATITGRIRQTPVMPAAHGVVGAGLVTMTVLVAVAISITPLASGAEAVTGSVPCTATITLLLSGAAPMETGDRCTELSSAMVAVTVLLS